MWGVLGERGAVEAEEIEGLFDGDEDREALARLVRRRLAFRSPGSGRVHALSRLVQHLL